MGEFLRITTYDAEYSFSSGSAIRIRFLIFNDVFLGHFEQLFTAKDQ